MSSEHYSKDWWRCTLRVRLYSKGAWAVFDHLERIMDGEYYVRATINMVATQSGVARKTVERTYEALMAQDAMRPAPEMGCKYRIRFNPGIGFQETSRLFNRYCKEYEHLDAPVNKEHRRLRRQALKDKKPRPPKRDDITEL